MLGAVAHRRADGAPASLSFDRNHGRSWVLPTYGYKIKNELLNNVKIAIIDRAVEKHNQLRDQQAKAGMSMLTIDDLLKSSRKRQPGRPKTTTR
jgi:hypothetical protein